tara:strand:- start:201 stop:1259 length:1059 start_codon:yes stop_codon:yes gene_type:complete
MVELVQPQLGHKIADPACGTGGFLLGAYQYIVTQLAMKAGAKNVKPDEDGFVRSSVAASLTEKVQATLDSSLIGYDIDSTMVRLGLMNLMMHGIDEPQIDYKDTLSKGYDEEAKYDIIMANPPFTGSIDRGDISERLQISTTKTELLFVENIYRILRKGGTAAVIIPQGVLFGTGRAFVSLRRLLVESCDLKAVITMPSGVFKPYAGVSTAILIFTKIWGVDDKVSKPGTDHVWFFGMKDDGYSLDDKRIKKEGSGDLQHIVASFHSREPKTDSDRKLQYFFVPREEIEDKDFDLSFGSYNEDIYEEIEYEDPKEIIENLLETEIGVMKEAELEKIQSGIVRELLDLRGMIK